MNFLSLDLELNNSREGLPDPKIIQVGISVGNLDSGILLTKCWFLDPGEPIFEFITGLTGITDFEIAQKSISMKLMSEELSDIIKKYECFVNPVTWGAGDAIKLIADLKQNDIYFPHFGRRELDVKQIYTYLMICQNRSLKSGLSSALGRFKLQFRGRPHRADADAENTLLLFFKLIERQQKLEELLSLTRSVQ
jgi:inhibitor of KinA sporulation pathway (predicted exonuclease)